MRVRELPGRVDLVRLAERDPARYPCLLESAAAHPRTGRYDLLFACDPEHSWQEPPHDPAVRGGGFLERLDRCWRAARGPAVREAPGDLPFQGGWVLFLSYELAAECEPGLRLPAPGAPLPRALALRSPAVVLYDHARARTLLVAEAGHEEWLERLAHDVAALASHDAPESPFAAVDWLEDEPARFLAGVDRIHRYLAAGDTFQVNLSREWRAELGHGVAPARLYRALRSSNPAPFSGLLQLGGGAILSSSPERLVRVRGDQIETRPIAGTRPRSRAGEDVVRIDELIGHPKERAEHVMLLDLERNDLGRVAVPGSVEVNELMTVESYTHVHHIVSNVRARLRPGVTPGAVIRAVFPGGTITGCPKVRCMEIIAELEGEGRGPYTGALGYLNHDGSMDLNILIRTLWLAGPVARVRAGSGIVADSDPARELEETRAKARGVLDALGAR